MKSNNANGNKSTDSNLGKTPGKKPNMEPNEPFLSSKEKEEKEKNNLERKERDRIRASDRRRRIAEEQGRKLRKFENLDHLSPEERKERDRQKKNCR
jgi:hypothetical protein